MGEAFDDVTDHVGFDQNSTSLCCGRIQDNALVQVCPDRVILSSPVFAPQLPSATSGPPPPAACTFVWTPLAHPTASCSAQGGTAGSGGTPGVLGAPAAAPLGPAGISVAAVGSGVVLLALARPGALVMLACVAGLAPEHTLGLQEVRRCSLSHELSSISISSPCLGQPWALQHRQTRPQHHADSCPMQHSAEDSGDLSEGTPEVYPAASGALAVLGTYQPGVVVISLDRDPEGACYPVLASASLEAVQAAGARPEAGAAGQEGAGAGWVQGLSVAGVDQPGGWVPESACLVFYDRLYVVCGLRSGALVRFAWPLPSPTPTPTSGAVPQDHVSLLGSPWRLPRSAGGTPLAAQLPVQPGSLEAPDTKKHGMDVDGVPVQAAAPQSVSKELDFDVAGPALTVVSSPLQTRGEGSGRGNAARESSAARASVTAFLCKGSAGTISADMNSTVGATAADATGSSSGSGRSREGAGALTGGAPSGMGRSGSGVRLELAAQRRVGVSPVHLTPLGPCLGSDLLALSDRPWLVKASQGSSRPACLPISFPAASHGAPLSCPQCPQGLLFISHRSLSIVSTTNFCRRE